jgi:hypothetical protein
MDNHTNQFLSDDSSIDDLLDAIEKRLTADPSIDDKKRAERMGHYCWTANELAKALSVRRQSLTSRQLFDAGPRFKKYLSRRRISKSAKAVLGSYRNSIIREAKQLGLFAERHALEQNWRPAKKAMKGVAAGLSIINEAIKCNLRMDQYSDAALDEWGSEKLRQGCAFRFVISRKSAFRGAIRRAGLAAQFPMLRTEIAPTFRVRARELPSWLRRDIAQILRKMRAEARRDLHRFPYSSARGLVLRFQELFGFAQGTPEASSINSLEQLLSEDLIRKYILFLYEDKDWKRVSIRVCVYRIANAMSYHPVLGQRDFSWIRACVLELSEDDDTDIDPESDGAEVLLDDLAAIPKKLRAKREALKGKNRRAIAWLAVKEFIIFWLVTHPWPAQCLRTCRISGSKRNLFKGPKPRGKGPFELFPRLEQALRKNPRLRFWQFDISPAETRLGRYARGGLVSPLTRKLKEYFKYRRELVKGKPDPGTLLVNFAGQAFECGEFSKLVADICYDYVGVRIPPSEFRRKFLFDWLADCPGDLEGIAVVLWMQVDSVSALLERNNVENYPIARRRGRRAWIRRCRAYWKL